MSIHFEKWIFFVLTIINLQRIWIGLTIQKKWIEQKLMLCHVTSSQLTWRPHVGSLRERLRWTSGSVFSPCWACSCGSPTSRCRAWNPCPTSWKHFSHKIFWISCELNRNFSSFWGIKTSKSELYCYEKYFYGNTFRIFSYCRIKALFVWKVEFLLIASVFIDIHAVLSDFICKIDRYWNL